MATSPKKTKAESKGSKSSKKKGWCSSEWFYLTCITVCVCVCARIFFSCMCIHQCTNFAVIVRAYIDVYDTDRDIVDKRSG